MSIEIEHIHLTECDSTQLQLEKYLKDPKKKKDILISSLFQTLGRGRQGNTWTSLENSIALSFVIKPSEVLTLTSLEVGALICNFFKNYDLKLKWPNDLLTHDGFKCGGILCQNSSGLILVGVGLNLGKSQRLSKSEEFKFGRSSICDVELSKDHLKKISYDLYKYILENRMCSKSIMKVWNSKCFHLNKKVSLIDNSFSISGIFSGIGEKGEALILDSGHIKKLYSGSLYLD